MNRLREQSAPAPAGPSTGNSIRGLQYLSVVAVAAVLLSPLALFGGIVVAASVLLGAMALFLVSGWIQIVRQSGFEDAPEFSPTPAYAAWVALDNLVLGLISLMNRTPSSAELVSARAEMDAAHALFEERGWIGAPAAYHATPPAPPAIESRALTHRGFALNAITFASGYDPDRSIPGGDRWLSYRENATVHAHVLRNDGGERRWIVCIHGAGMGTDLKMDFDAFRVADLHRRHGFNVALFTLPVHGPRSPTRVSGVRFFGASPMDFIHAESQAVWDLRRLIAWIRSQGATEVGLFGISLGGYTAALLACIESDLAFVVACVPPSDVALLNDGLAGRRELRRLAAAGIDQARVRALYSVVSPLAAPPLVPPSGRFIYAAAGDRFAPTAQALALWRHWERPCIYWCKGGHISAVFLQRALRAFVDRVAERLRRAAR